MKILVCGDRNWTDKEAMYDVLCEYHRYGTEIVLIHGGCRGADRLAGECAEDAMWDILVYPADWQRYGRAAGPIRNQKMLDEGKPDIVIAFHSNLDKSKGTKDMVTRTRKARIPVEVYRERHRG